MKRFARLLMLCSLAAAGFSQTASASVVGRVTDATGAVVPGVLVKITSLDTIVINTSLSRRIRFAESRSLQFRLESFNLPNHPNFNLPENNVNVRAGNDQSREEQPQPPTGLRFEF